MSWIQAPKSLREVLLSSNSCTHGLTIAYDIIMYVATARYSGSQVITIYGKTFEGYKTFAVFVVFTQLSHKCFTTNYYQLRVNL